MTVCEQAFLAFLLVNAVLMALYLRAKLRILQLEEQLRQERRTPSLLRGVEDSIESRGRR